MIPCCKMFFQSADPFLQHSKLFIAELKERNNALEDSISLQPGCLMIPCCRMFFQSADPFLQFSKLFIAELKKRNNALEDSIFLQPGCLMIPCCRICSEREHYYQGWSSTLIATFSIRKYPNFLDMAEYVLSQCMYLGRSQWITYRRHYDR